MWMIPVCGVAPETSSYGAKTPWEKSNLKTAGAIIEFRDG